MWFIEVQNGGADGDAPVWGIAAAAAVRLLADFVGAWLVISVSQLLVTFLRLGIDQLRARRQQE